MTKREYNEYVYDLVARKEAMYIMELMLNGVDVNLASCNSLTKNYVDNFGYLKSNECIGEYIKSLYCAEYLSNGGYSTIDGRPLLIDFAGFYEEC